MTQTLLAFDVYGTLINPSAMAEVLRPTLNEQAESVAAQWRASQLQLAFRRGLMGRYVEFSVCTRDALDVAIAAQDVEVDASTRDEWLAAYSRLPAFEEVDAALASLVASGYRCVAFSNGTENAMQEVLGNAGLAHHFEALVSVDDIKRFKPDPVVYHHLARRMNVAHDNAWLVSSNNWDIQGARHAGLKAAWIHRDKTALIEDPSLAPDIEVERLDELAQKLAKGA
ncbi:haloacid dehalogenase type II [Kushneria indalinina]|uniref:(S)-2-haloacid dehalogenase n=1 Tax=Kushneria indalinina DSM 14324 TaxID=1122140 RepID=A0A3D9DUZ0_9GAMM|nr:haloacid dehalogenase type II [Kushneria indalinina]REC94199.1 2-haloacid dehalogenase [Kushneria indalinina DSM 14324]